MYASKRLQGFVNVPRTWPQTQVLSFSFFSRFLGVAAPPAFVTLRNCVAAALGFCGVFSRSLLGGFKGRSVADEAGDFCVSFEGTGTRPFCGSERRGSFVVLDLESGWLWTRGLGGRG